MLLISSVFIRLFGVIRVPFSSFSIRILLQEIFPSTIALFHRRTSHLQIVTIGNSKGIGSIQ